MTISQGTEEHHLQTDSKSLVPNDVTRRLPRQADGEGFFLYCSGGIRATQVDGGAWLIEPIFDSGPCAKGIWSAHQIQTLFKQHGFKEIAFHHAGWLKGDYYSSWSPIVPGRKNHMIGPADIWAHIAGNLSRTRTAPENNTLDGLSHQQVAAVFDGRDEIERLAQSISLSLRGMDINVEQIADFYNEQLVSQMASGLLDGRKSSTTLDQMLYAHVHSFFMHIGAARDYLAALIGFRLGKDKNSLAWLADALKVDDLEKDALLSILQKRGYLGKKTNSTNKVEVAGWLAEMTEIRNRLMHRRPYGSLFVEKMGYAVVIDSENGLYRYTRPIVMDEGECDVLDLVIQHYRAACSLFLDCAEQSGLNTDMPVLSVSDIISVDVGSS